MANLVMEPMTNRRTPVMVDGLTNVKSISAGSSHSCAALDNGSAMCWGNNSNGQLGDGSRILAPLNTWMVSGLTNVKSISAGTSHSCVALDNGSAMCWGNNGNGRLGDGTTLSTCVVNGLTNVKSISAGQKHTCTALDNGSAMCWGIIVGSNWQWI